MKMRVRKGFLIQGFLSYNSLIKLSLEEFYIFQVCYERNFKISRILPCVTFQARKIPPRKKITIVMEFSHKFYFLFSSQESSRISFTRKKKKATSQESSWEFPTKVILCDLTHTALEKLYYRERLLIQQQRKKCFETFIFLLLLRSIRQIIIKRLTRVLKLEGERRKKSSVYIYRLIRDPSIELNRHMCVCMCMSIDLRDGLH